MPKYSWGKQTNLLSFQEFQSQVEKAKLPLEKEAFIWLLYYVGCRKSEAYERTTGDVQVTESHFIIDVKRKKGGAEVPAIKLSRSWAGVPGLVKLYQRAAEKKPKRKRIYYQENRTTLSKVVRDHWLFPHISSATALRLVKEVLGSKFYPHFLRLNRISEILSDPTGNVTRIKSYTGIKTVKVIEAYMGVSEKEQEAALTFMEKRMKPQDQ